MNGHKHDKYFEDEMAFGGEMSGEYTKGRRRDDFPRSLKKMAERNPRKALDWFGDEDRKESYVTIKLYVVGSYCDEEPDGEPKYSLCHPATGAMYLVGSDGVLRLMEYTPHLSPWQRFVNWWRAKKK